MTPPECGRSLMIVAGDISGENHTSKIIPRLKELAPDIKIWGVGGPKMEAAGMELLFDTSKFAVIGIFEVVNKITFFIHMYRTLLAAVKERQPDAILLVDFGGFNIRLATYIRRSNKSVPICYFVSPQVWGSRPWRINALKKAITKMLTIFPFEEKIYQNQNVDARFVGHPILKHMPDLDQVASREELCASLGLDASKPIIIVMPGSRKREIKDHMPVVAQGIKEVLALRPDTQFILARATQQLSQLIDEGVKKYGLSEYINKGLVLTDSSRNFELMKNCDLIWAKSGTTTLETALFGKPMLIFYTGNWFSYFLVMGFKTVKNFGWPNLLAGYELVPELIQLDCRGEKLVKYTLDLLDVPALRQEISEELLTLRAELGEGDFVENCAQEVLAIVNKAHEQKVSAGETRVQPQQLAL